MITLSVTDAARGFSDLVNRVRYHGETATLLKGGKPVAMLSPFPKPHTGAELAKMWPEIHHLPGTEADSFAKDMAEARKRQPLPQSKWD